MSDLFHMCSYELFLHIYSLKKSVFCSLGLLESKLNDKGNKIRKYNLTELVKKEISYKH